MNSFAQRFKKLRESYGMTQDVVAEKLGIQRPTIAGYESPEKNRIPREETLNRIADLFNTSIDYLMGRTDDPSPSIKSSNNGGRAFLGGADNYTEEELEVANAAAQAAIEALRKSRAKKKQQ